MQCVNNLKQIGLSLHNYHSSINALPWDHGPGGWNEWSGLTMLLPYMEQQPLYNAINFTNNGDIADPGNAINTTVIRSKVTTFLCPSDLDRPTNIEGHNNYVMNAGADALGPETVDTLSGIGISLYNATPPISFASIIDGLSNTAAFSEITKGIGTSSGTADPLTPSTAIRQVSAFSGTSQTDYNSCTAALATSLVGDFAFGMYWHTTQRDMGHYKHVMPPNSWSCSNPNNLNQGAFTASSRHPGSVSMLLCDGSVKTIKSSISPPTWWALGTRAGNEVISSDSF